MSTLLITHKVKNYPAWKGEFDNFVDFRKKSGEKSYRILHSTDDPNNLTLLFEWDNKKNAETFLSSSELKSTMERAGVIEEPKIRFLDQVDQGEI